MKEKKDGKEKHTGADLYFYLLVSLYVLLYKPSTDM